MLKSSLATRAGAAFLILLSLALSWKYLVPSSPAPPADPVLREFQSQIWPLLTRGGASSCVECHDAESKSDLHFFSDPASSLAMLKEKGYLSTNEPDSLLGRITSGNPKKRMPKGKRAVAWTPSEVDRLRRFASSFEPRKSGNEEENFPTALLAPYTGTKPASLDNQFITYRQLRGKIEAIFGDDWVRNGRDLFQENLSLFGGADFKTRFNETAKASATFLTGMEMLARDVSSRAYAQRSGPFVGWQDDLPPADEIERPDTRYRARIAQLYQSILFRRPTEAEVTQAFHLIKGVYAARPEIESSDYDLSVELSVRDPATGLASSRVITIPVSGRHRSLYQEWVDETAPPAPDPAAERSDEAAAKAAAEEQKKETGRRKEKPVSNRLVKHRLGRSFTFKKGDQEQYFKLHNANSVGNVSFQAIELAHAGRSEGGGWTRTIKASDPEVQADGAWKSRGSGETVSLEDENNAKGNSTVLLPIDVPEDGLYDVTLVWRFNPDNAAAVLTEVSSHDQAALAPASVPEVPPRGEARYYIDESDDTMAFADLKTSFKFGENDYVEINNQGTRRRVTADAVKFVGSSKAETFLVDNDEADGREAWEPYDSGQFKAYNQTGKNTFHDKNERKGELFLRYRPSSKTNVWQTNAFYQVQVGYPAKQDHEIRTPVIVRARESSPIIQAGYPLHAAAGTELQIDASHSYTVQQSALEYHWTQLDGPRIDTANLQGPALRFALPRQDVRQLAWEALCRGLMRHPDFLFTRPPSLAGQTDERERKRLQLVKIALDLAGRAPTAAEIDRLDRGVSLAEMADGYLASEEFRDFYFHRIRLYLESQGTETQDEPARLWCYVAFNDRPFQEILLADYTVDSKMQKKARPAYHGRTGVLTTRGFIEGKPGLPHFNYAAQVAELFLGYVFEVPPEIVQQREGITAVATTDPASLCYSCHKVLTPLAFQRTRWDDQGRFRQHDEYGMVIDDSDQQLVASYPFAGDGLEAFAGQAVKKERFIRTMINTHFTFYFGREMRYEQDERDLYKRLWDEVHRDQFKIRGLIKAMLLSPEYLNGQSGQNNVLAFRGMAPGAVNQLHSAPRSMN